MRPSQPPSSAKTDAATLPAETRRPGHRHDPANADYHPADDYRPARVLRPCRSLLHLSRSHHLSRHNIPYLHGFPDDEPDFLAGLKPTRYRHNPLPNATAMPKCHGRTGRFCPTRSIAIHGSGGYIDFFCTAASPRAALPPAPFIQGASPCQSTNTSVPIAATSSVTSTSALASQHRPARSAKAAKRANASPPSALEWRLPGQPAPMPTVARAPPPPAATNAAPAAAITKPDMTAKDSPHPIAGTFP